VFTLTLTNDELGEQSMGRTTRLTHKAGYHYKMAAHNPTVEPDEESRIHSVLSPAGMSSAANRTRAFMDFDHAHTAIKQIER